MEIQTSLPDHDDEKPNSSPEVSIYHSKVDTTRPFRSVKEAVAIFGERFLAGEIYAPKAFSFTKQESPVCFYTPSPSPQQSQEFEEPGWKSADSNDPGLAEFLKKLETELEETKMELKVLKEKESETEVALASLNAELHKNMSRIAQAEASAAGKAHLMASRSTVLDRIKRQDGGDQRSDGIREEDKRRDLAQMLGIAAEKEGLFGGRFNKEKRVVKKKPIIPLVGDLFSWKKASSTSVINPLYSSPHVNLN